MENEEVTTEETLEEQFEKVKAALERAKAEAKKFREERDALKTQVTELEARPDASELQAKLVKFHAEKALAKMGVKDSTRILKFVDLDGVELDAEGNLTGFEEKVNTVKADLPELFDAKKRVGGAGDAFANGEVQEKKNPLAAQIANALGNR